MGWGENWESESEKTHGLRKRQSNGTEKEENNDNNDNNYNISNNNNMQIKLCTMQLLTTH